MNYQLSAAISPESLRLFMIGLSLVHRGNFHEAISLLKSVIALEKSNSSHQPADLVTIYLQLGLTYSLINRQDLALGSYEEALHICQKQLRNSSFHASVLLRLFAMYVLLADAAAARSIGLDLLSMHEIHNLLDLPSQGALLLKLGELEELRGELVQANSYFQRASIAFNDLLGENNHYSQAIRERCLKMLCSSPQLLNNLVEKDKR